MSVPRTSLEHEGKVDFSFYNYHICAIEPSWREDELRSKLRLVVGWDTPVVDPRSPNWHLRSLRHAMGW
jgi:hypothetical protein